ncbi:hypothetical protein MVEN_01722600 [Mycena venus]|uniref:Uncharacterized protein n=1 Tax=Mycena venus TaxID=2733690 RepID=A0A8H6XLP7_9AGAR|nr:hypothetical protein MVEN_01722600 [Mycena venus]
MLPSSFWARHRTVGGSNELHSSRSQSTKTLGRSLANDSNDKGLNQLVHTIRKHLLKKDSTTAANFISVINSIAEKKRIQLKGSTEEKVREFFAIRFPNVTPQEFGGGKRLWGMVRDESAIQLAQEIIDVYHDAVTSNSFEMRVQLEMVLLVTILHELSHTLVKHFFPGHITPRGIGYDSANPKYGESGDFIEQAVFGFKLLVEWKTDDYWNMQKIRQLIAQSRDGGTRLLPPDEYRQILESLDQSTLYRVDFNSLHPAPHHIDHARGREEGASKPIDMAGDYDPDDPALDVTRVVVAMDDRPLDSRLRESDANNSTDNTIDEDEGGETNIIRDSVREDRALDSNDNEEL